MATNSYEAHRSHRSCPRVGRSNAVSAVLSFLVLAILFSTSPAWADPPFTRLFTVPVPGKPLASVDIGWFDEATRAYYLADRTNKGVDIFSFRTGFTRLGGFVGSTGNNDTSGPNGVLVDPTQNQLWAGDGNSTVKVFDLNTNNLIANISTGGKNRADELAIDPKDGIVLIVNDADDPPFVTFISTASKQIVGKIELGGATNGVEQPLWVRHTHRFYVAIPEIFGDKGLGGILLIDPLTMQVTGLFEVFGCQPHGLALGPNQNMVVGCSADAIAAGFPAQVLIVNAQTGGLVATIPQVGGCDEVWYNPGDEKYFLACRQNPAGPVLGIIDATTNTWLQNVPTGPGNVPHSVAAEPDFNAVFVPLRANPADPACLNSCIGVYWGTGD